MYNNLIILRRVPPCTYIVTNPPSFDSSTFQIACTRPLYLYIILFYFSLSDSVRFAFCCPGSVTARYTLKWICIIHKHIFLIPDVRALAARNHQSVASHKLIGRASRPAIIIENFIYIARRRAAHASERENKTKRLFPFVFSPTQQLRLYLFSAARKGHDSHKLNAAAARLKVLVADEIEERERKSLPHEKKERRHITQ